MASEYDVVIRGGTIMDGNGGAPFVGDVAVKDGKIAEIGKVSGSGAEEIDADGLSGHAGLRRYPHPLRRPGDVGFLSGAIVLARRHHRRDGQLRRRLRAGSQEHPGRGRRADGRRRGHSRPLPERRPRLDLGKFRRISHRAGTPQARHRFLRPAAARADARLRHGRPRAEPGGRQPGRHRPQMREITAEAVRAGAFGFSTSRTIAHKTLAGDPTPTLRAQENELMGIAMGLKDAGKGFIEMTSDWNTPDPATEFAMVRRIIAGLRPAAGVLVEPASRPDQAWKDLLALSTQAAADGLPIRCVAPPRPIGALLGLTGSQNPFAGTRTYRSIAHLPLGAARRRDARSGGPGEKSSPTIRRSSTLGRC